MWNKALIFNFYKNENSKNIFDDPFQIPACQERIETFVIKFCNPQLFQIFKKKSSQFFQILFFCFKIAEIEEQLFQNV